MGTENNQDAEQASLKKADQLRLSGAFSQARELLEQLIKKNPFFSPAKLALGRVFFESGQLEEARKTLEEFSEFVPDHPLANKILAKIYLHSSQHVKAKKKIDMVIDSNPEDTFAKRMAEQIEEESSEYSPDIADTKKTSYTGKTATIAEIYRNQGHLKEALEIYQELSNQNSGSAEYRQKIAEIQKQLSPQPAEKQPVSAPAATIKTPPPIQQTVSKVTKPSEVMPPKKTRKEKLERLLYVVQQHRNHVRS